MLQTLITYHQWLVLVPLFPVALVSLAMWECRR